MDKISFVLMGKFAEGKIWGDLRIGRIGIASYYASACGAKTGFDHRLPLHFHHGVFELSRRPSRSLVLSNGTTEWNCQGVQILMD